MTLKDFELGDEVRVSAIFKNTAGAAIDPDNVYFKFRDPASAEVIYTFGADAQIVKDSVGHYHVDIDAAAVGVWSWKFYSTGSGKGADAGRFKVVSNY